MNNLIYDVRGMRAKVNEIRSELTDYGFRPPYIIMDICNKLDDYCLEFVPFCTKGLRGIVSMANDKDPLNCILINSNLDYLARNYHGFHEFMHTKMHKNRFERSFCYDNSTIRDKQDPYIEWEANSGAAYLLAPPHLFIPEFCKLYSHLKFGDGGYWVRTYGVQKLIDIIALKFRITPVVVKFLLQEYSYEIDQYLSDKSFDELNVVTRQEQKELGIVPTNYAKIVQRRQEEILNSWKYGLYMKKPSLHYVV